MTLTLDTTLGTKKQTLQPVDVHDF